MTLNWNNWRELWASLPESGWPVSEVMRFLRNPPKWFVACSSAFGLFVVGRAVYLIAFGSAEEVNKYIVGVAAFAGAPFLIWRTWIADRQRHIAQEELYTSLLTKAVDQLGSTREEKRFERPEFEAEFGMERPGHFIKKEISTQIVPNIEVRLGAIYALEKLAQDYFPLHWQIMEILCAYVRENVGKPRPCSSEVAAIYAKRGSFRASEQEEKILGQRSTELQLRVDLQAALTVIGRRSQQQRQLEQKEAEASGSWVRRRLNLTRCHLASADMFGLHFERANFSGSSLERAWLVETHIEDAVLDHAHLEGAILAFAHLQCAQLAHAHLEGAVLDGANAQGAALGEVEGLTQDQINGFVGDEKTIIPEKLERPSHWSKSNAA